MKLCLRIGKKYQDLTELVGSKQCFYIVSILKTNVIEDVKLKKVVMK